MSQQQPSQDPMVGEVSFKVPLPLLIPFAVLFVIAGVTIGMSKVLLNIPAEAATVVALAVAANVLIAAAFLAGRRQGSVIEMGVIVLYPVLIGIVIALLNIGQGEATTSGDGPAPVAAGPVSAGGTMVTAEISFSSDSIELDAGKDAEITVQNDDTTPHNIYIYESAADADSLNDDATLFQGEDVPAGDSATYSIPALKAGDHPFICRIHPTMAGTVTVK
jgi:plastocyanin